jgi:uncharacterized protein (DUF2384 family)
VRPPKAAASPKTTTRARPRRPTVGPVRTAAPASRLAPTPSPVTGHPSEFVDRPSDSAAVLADRERPLKIFAFDPSRGRQKTNIVTLRLPYERLEPGPVGEYVAVVDEDEARHETYPMVDLEAKEVLLAGGLDPSELDLRFHQQMVYAVTMRTIKAFEQALGRAIRWPWSSSDKNRLTNRLRLYPHASGDANAHFDPSTGAIRFGYAPPTDANGNPTSVDELVFTSLSFDVIAHETVHALLSAIFPVSPATNDAAALHEGLADIVALLGHFEFRDAVVETIERTGGRIYAPTMAADVEAPTSDRLILAERARANPLLEIAPQFGAALGMGGALRTALGSPPDPAALALATEPHDRGSILVAAVFDALFSVHSRRTRDLMRIAGVSNATGDRARIHPDLAVRLAAEATKTARHFMTICVRALDYCPPVNADFGDYLRAIVTSDTEVVPNDDWGYRQAFIDSFRARGVTVPGVRSYSEEGLRWGEPARRRLPAAKALIGAEGRRATARIRGFVNDHPADVGLATGARIQVDPAFVRSSRRIGPDGRGQREVVAKVIQRRPSSPDGTDAGATLIIDEAGGLKYVIAKATTSRRRRLPLLPKPRAARDRDHRPLKVFAFDPSRGRSLGNHMTITVPFEPLEPGPIGRQIAVIDYDATNDRYYRATDLDALDVLLRGGLEPSDLDPAFHQQMVYGVVSSAVERFEAALGRPIRWQWARGRSRPPLGDRLRIFPHAMAEANAYYDRRQRALLFGYFPASDDRPGRNLPGQIVFTCLSHDIVVHEATHAMLDSVRPYFMEPSGPDALAFHEAFADVVALLQHFSFPDALLETIRRTGGRIHATELLADSGPTPGGARIRAQIAESNPLIELALQFGEALGNRAALRSALGTPPDPAALEAAEEVHDRGAILVAAVFDAFFSVYVRRTADLMRLARDGGSVSPSGDIGPELADRLAREATDTAARVASMCIRALDYCPPVGLEFGDFLRAVVTADFEREPDDPLGFRSAFIDAFGWRGIYPSGVRSMSEEALRWSQPTGAAVLECPGLDPDPRTPPDHRANAIRLATFARANAEALGLDPGLPINVDRYEAETSQQLDRYGGLRAEFNVQIVQRRTAPVDGDDGDGASFVFRGGSTIILDGDGKLIYLIGKGVANADREEIQRRYLQAAAAAGSAVAYRGSAIPSFSFAAVHRGE